MEPPPPPLNFELSEIGEKLITIEDLTNEVAELATQLATPIVGNVDHFMVEQEILCQLDHYENNNNNNNNNNNKNCLSENRML